MTGPDLELAAGLSAGELRTHVVPDAQVQTTGRWVIVERSETRIGIGERTEAGGSYRNVVVEKRLAAGVTRAAYMPIAWKPLST
jgi:hypothetical protein